MKKGIKINDMDNTITLHPGITDKISGVFNKELIENAARESRFVQRSTGKIEGGDFLRLMTVETMEKPFESLAGLCDILRDINSEADISCQALSYRINSKSAVTFLECILNRAIWKNLETVSDAGAAESLLPFNRIFIEDSTQCILNEKLAEDFKGSGGSASASALKINLIYELSYKIIQDLYITDCREPDQSLSVRIFNHLQAGDLVIRDLGYFKIDVLTLIAEAEAFFLSRLLKGVKVYLTPDKNGSAMAPGKYITENHPDQSVIGIDVFIGAQRLPGRLIVYKLPDDVVNARRRKANAAAKKKGGKLSKDHSEWLRFSIYITNAGEDILPPETVGTVYRIRWQIELIFKSWKSLLNIHVLKGTVPERIKCYLYGRLIVIAVMTVLYSYASRYALRQFQREVSEYKLICWLKRLKRLEKIIFSGMIGEILIELKRDILRNCKQKRKRKTVRELVLRQIPYMQSFDQNYLITGKEAG